jgi:hypothetical protein
MHFFALFSHEFFETLPNSRESCDKIKLAPLSTDLNLLQTAYLSDRKGFSKRQRSSRKSPEVHTLETDICQEKIVHSINLMVSLVVSLTVGAPIAQ